jgi:hypothetical protein
MATIDTEAVDSARALEVLGPGYYVAVVRGCVYVDSLGAGRNLATLYLTDTLYRAAGAWDCRRSLLAAHHEEQAIRRLCEDLGRRHAFLRLSTGDPVEDHSPRAVLRAWWAAHNPCQLFTSQNRRRSPR